MIHPPKVTRLGTELPITDIKGKPYLQVAYRLVWFREEHPDWTIRTEMVHYTSDFAVVRAEVADPTGTVLATGHKAESKDGWGDFLEKAETGAIGRALAILGYGTQFDPGLDEGERLADSPMASPDRAGDTNAARPTPKASGPTIKQQASELRREILELTQDGGDLDGRSVEDRLKGAQAWMDSVPDSSVGLERLTRKRDSLKKELIEGRAVV